MSTKVDFHEGQYIVYINGETAQIGQIKRLMDDGAFVYYHEGNTAAKTPYTHILPIQNAHVIKEISLNTLD